jgi:hypothetical protein
MNQHLIAHVDAWLANASDFVCRYMPVDITIDNAYEEMLACSTVNTAEMITAFREAVKYLQPTSQYKRLNFTIGGRIAMIDTRFTPTAKWPTFLIPNQNIVIDPESKFAALLDTPIRVATEWMHLEYVWQQLRHPRHTLTNEQLVYLLPWLRECLADFDITSLPVEVKLADRKIIAKEHTTIMRDTDVLFFPRLSKALMGVARSGRTLISQYRMIEAAYSRDTLTQSPITVERTPTLVESWVIEHFVEAMDQWQRDKSERTSREFEAIMMRAAAKRAKNNPKGNLS